MTTAQLESRVLSVIEHQLLAPELVEEFEREYRRISAERGKTSVREREVLERRLAAAQRKVMRFVQAVADGGSEFVEIRSGLATAKADAAAIEAELAELATAPVIALHPGIADDYRRRVANLREL